MSDNTQETNPLDGNTGNEDVKAGVGQQPVGSEPTPSAKDTANKTEGVVDDNDPLTRLTAEHETLQKRYKDAERKITELGQDRSDTRRSFETLTNQLADLQAKLAAQSKKPLPSKEEFIASVNEKGLEALMPYINEPVNEVKSHYEKELEVRDQRIMQMELDYVKDSMERDGANYPGFKELWPEMQKLARDPNAPVNFDLGVKPSLISLYKLTRADHSGDAILEAEKKAKADAEAGLVKEAKTTITGGGKKGSATKISDDELRKMPIDKLKDLVAGMHGVADRD